MAKYIAGITCLLFSITILTGCKKFAKQGALNMPGIALTFDDNMIDSWYRFLPQFDSAGAKVTFYICKYNRLTQEQKNKLAIIQSHGHEIAYHTTNHYNMVDYVYKYHHTMEELMLKEIEGGLKQMNRDGFYPTTFAYPYGAHNAVMDNALKRYFKSVRALNGTKDFSKSLAPTRKNDLLYGLGIDKSSNRSDADLVNMLNAAVNNNNCAVLVAHDINTNSKYCVSSERLHKIFTFVKNNGLQYYTVSQISD